MERFLYGVGRRGLRCTPAEMQCKQTGVWLPFFESAEGVRGCGRCRCELWVVCATTVEVLHSVAGAVETAEVGLHSVYNR